MSKLSFVRKEAGSTSEMEDVDNDDSFLEQVIIAPKSTAIIQQYKPTQNTQSYDFILIISIFLKHNVLHVTFYFFFGIHL